MNQHMHPIRGEALAGRAQLEARYPAIFRPNLKRRTIFVAGLFAATALFLFGFWFLGFSWTKIINGLGQLGSFLWFMFPPSMGMSATTAEAASGWLRCILGSSEPVCARAGELWIAMWRSAPFIWFHALAETVAIAFLGTLAAAVLAIPLGLLAARNVMANRLVQFMARRISDTIRGVDELIWALIWVNVVGLGPFAGVLAITTSFIGAFAKLYSEALEACDRRASEGVTATGGGGIHTLRFGLIPEVFPVIASQVLYFFESNTRSATIIGIVGAGGIGLHLSEQIRTLEWQHVSFLIIMILITVAIIDHISTKLRFAVIGKREQRLT
jgi:phosphonate transport system permease protein